MGDNDLICIVCKEPAKYLAAHCEKRGMKVTFCHKHIKDCYGCGKCTLETLK